MDEKTREEVKAIKKRISDLGTTYMSNLNEDTTYREFTKEELAGVPEDLVDSFEKVKRSNNVCLLKHLKHYPQAIALL